MRGKFLIMLLCAVISFNSFTVAHAATSEVIQLTPDFTEESYLESKADNTVYEFDYPTPFYDHISAIIIGLGISGNTAGCNLTVDAYPEVYKLSVYITLQRYLLGKWTNVPGASYHKEVLSSTIFFAPTKTLDTIGSYRFTTKIFAYADDGSVETIEDASNTEVY